MYPLIILHSVEIFQFPIYYCICILSCFGFTALRCRPVIVRRMRWEYTSILEDSFSTQRMVTSLSQTRVSMEMEGCCLLAASPVVSPRIDRTSVYLSNEPNGNTGWRCGSCNDNGIIIYAISNIVICDTKKERSEDRLCREPHQAYRKLVQNSFRENLVDAFLIKKYSYLSHTTTCGVFTRYHRTITCYRGELKRNNNRNGMGRKMSCWYSIEWFIAERENMKEWVDGGLITSINNLRESKKNGGILTRNADKTWWEKNIYNAPGKTTLGSPKNNFYQQEQEEEGNAYAIVHHVGGR